MSNRKEYLKQWWQKNKHKYKGRRSHHDPDWSKKHYQENKEEILNRNKERRDSNPEWRLWRSAKSSARRRGYEFTITVNDVIIPDECPILKVPMVRYTEYCPSIDRVDTSRGYIHGNVQVISKKANAMKSNATQDELLLFADWVIEKLRVK